MKSVALVFAALAAAAAPAAAFAPVRDACRHGRRAVAPAPLSMSAESRLLGVVAETNLLSKVADLGLLSKVSGSISLTDLEKILVEADKGLLDTAIAFAESPIAEGAVLLAAGESPFRNPFRNSIEITADDRKSVLLKKVADKKLLTLVAKKGLLAKADAAGFSLADIEPLLKTADDYGVVDIAAENIDEFGPFLVNFAPRALPLAGGVLGLLSGPPKFSAPEITAPSFSPPKLPSPPSRPTPAPKVASKPSAASKRPTKASAKKAAAPLKVTSRASKSTKATAPAKARPKAAARTSNNASKPKAKPKAGATAKSTTPKSVSRFGATFERGDATKAAIAPKKSKKVATAKAGKK